MEFVLIAGIVPYCCLYQGVMLDAGVGSCYSWHGVFLQLLQYHRYRTLRNYSSNDMDPLLPIRFWQLLVRLDIDIYPQNEFYAQ